MPKLKSLRAQVGTYGRVAANGIVEVDDPTARRLLETKRFVKASADDIAAAKARMEAFVAGSAQGVPAGFAPIAQRAEPALNVDDQATAEASAKKEADTKAEEDAKAANADAKAAKDKPAK